MFELKPAFDILLQRPDKLSLVTNEMFGETQRPVVSSREGALEGEAEMHDVEHLGRYVYEMTKAKVEALRQNGGVMPTREVDMEMGGANGDADEDEDADREENVLVPEEMAVGDPADDEDEDANDAEVVVS